MADETILLRDESGHEHRVTLEADGRVSVGDATLTVHAAPDGSVHIVGAANAVAWTAAIDETRWVFFDGRVYTFEVERPGRRRRATAHHGSLMAPMPATVRKVLVAAGDAVRRHDVLVVLEAMKMELPVRATADGRIERVNCREGDLVQPGVALIELEEREE
jgi:acetyl/propionyl-CoA carboxylase alpha subunit